MSKLIINYLHATRTQLLNRCHLRHRSGQPVPLLRKTCLFQAMYGPLSCILQIITVLYLMPLYLSTKCNTTFVQVLCTHTTVQVRSTCIHIRRHVLVQSTIHHINKTHESNTNSNQSPTRRHRSS
jgi:hypothetical protein